MLQEESSVVMQVEGCREGHGMQRINTDAAEICANFVLKKYSFVQLSDRQMSSIENEGVCPASNCPLVQGNPSEQDSESCINYANELGNLANASFDGGFVGKTPVNENREDLSDPAMIDKEDLDYVDHGPPLLLPGSMLVSGETVLHKHADVRICDLHISAHEKGDVKSPFGLSEIVSIGNGRGAGSADLGEGFKEILR
ncbi:uncharacterized protein Fot_14504 [Forsythia ovata]|uniref:Uncharacterized protein n=1 Tax=Forsythia ovata TaxID=205694 RepID=A0ABD1W6X8_9LAMI